MFNYVNKIKKVNIGGGILFQDLGKGSNMNVWHWNMADKSLVPCHTHEAEQFGYVIKGGFEMTIGNEKAALAAGDSYFIPSNVPHEFIAIGKTEAIDVFSPCRPAKDTPSQKEEED